MVLPQKNISILMKYNILKYENKLGYNSNMIINDSGTEKRYSKLVSINHEEFHDIVKDANTCRRGQYNKNNEYKHYKEYSIKILNDTGNYKEKAIVFDINGSIVSETLGERASIKFSETEITGMQGNMLIHNHPSGSGLSEADLRMALSGGLSEITAVTNKRLMYRLVLKSNLDYKKTMVEYTKARKRASSIFYEVVRDGLINREYLDKEYHHFVMSIFAKSTKGVHYESKRY